MKEWTEKDAGIIIIICCLAVLAVSGFRFARACGFI